MKEIPGKSFHTTTSKIILNDRSNEILRVLSEEIGKFWLYNGYIVVRMPIAKDKRRNSPIFYGNVEEKDP